MALNIKDADTDRLAREVAALTGESITDAVRVALEQRLGILRRRASVTSATDLAQIIARGRQRQRLDHRTDDEILGYDRDGLPT
ncbi:MAG: type II toxin-antitoxin system VapB family antitoxin [Acidimicrobiales bacterium]|nr:type II toxin-antitoxin system VapB family antitoxin [Acidimicrobiales bacterium]MCB9371631.1 type II toxin-antitoxin system VapB family antitoxin [Microthrixaceae bacterium]